ncbi:aromatic-L-amino-acid decarboxylase [Palaemon carinicauda]|uniref:aromatic-L-amino-acid decarboxylase n=1 Tax=Palaemon carinicauda TaxID=392227 RepID=UPI0035B62E1C
MPRARCSEELSTIHLKTTKPNRNEDLPVMDAEEYRKWGKHIVDETAEYLTNIRERRVLPDVKPGYMRALVPDHAPEEPEPFEHIYNDLEGVIMPGMMHWQSPHNHAYFPALNSYPSLLADMVADAINCLGFTWASSPAATELEMIVMDWLAKMIGLPDHFLHSNKDSHGGGVIQTTASEATFVNLLAARTETLTKILAPVDFGGDQEKEDALKYQVFSRLVAYCSNQAHSSVEKAGLIGFVRLRLVDSDDNLAMRPDDLLRLIADDRRDGYIPFFVCATLGTTGSCSFDNLDTIGPICQENDMWLHVDAAYAGAAFICPEFRHYMKGIEYAHSIAFNPSKWLMVHFDCTAMWVRDSQALHRGFNVDPIYLQHENTGLAIDFMHWQVGLSKRFRSLKLWWVIRSFGVKGLQKHIRESVRLAAKFEAFVRSDPRFEIPAARHLGMVVFRLKGENELTEKLLKKMNSEGKVHCVPASLKGKYVIRFTVTSQYTTVDDLTRDWNVIRATASAVLSQTPAGEEHRTRVFLKDTRKNPNFGTSLLLANSPMSPKIVNGSFAAIFDNSDVLFEFAKKLQQLKLDVQDSPGKAMRRRIKGMLMAGKQYSLDSRMDIVTTLVSSAKTANGMPTMRENSVETEYYERGEMLDSAVQTDDMSSPHSRRRSKSVDDSISVPDLKGVILDDAINEADLEESSSPEAETRHSMREMNGRANSCHQCGASIPTM